MNALDRIDLLAQDYDRQARTVRQGLGATGATQEVAEIWRARQEAMEQAADTQRSLAALCRIVIIGTWATITTIALIGGIILAVIS